MYARRSDIFTKDSLCPRAIFATTDSRLHDPCGETAPIATPRDMRAEFMRGFLERYDNQILRLRLYLDHVKGTPVGQLQLAVFCFFYLPLIYWSGWALHATKVIDFPGYYLAAHNVFIDGTTPYGFDVFDSYAELFGRWMPPYVYPPPSILAFWPLTFFSIKSSFVAFTFISHLCLLGSMWLIIMRLSPLPRQLAARTVFICFSVAYVLSFDAVKITLELGQINLIVLFLICLSLLALQEGSPPWRIAAPLSIAILLKTYPVFLLILFVARRRFRATALTLTFFGVFVAIAAVVIPPYVWSTWLTEVVPAASSTKYMNFLFSHTPLDFTWNQSIEGVFKRLLGDTIWGHPPLSWPALAAPLIKVSDALVIGITSFFAFRYYKRRRPVDGVADDTAAFLLMMYLVAPVSWDHHLVYILPAAVLALGFILDRRIRGKAAVGLAVILCMLAWRVELDASLFQKYWWALLGFAKFYAVAALWIFFVVRLSRASSRTPEEYEIRESAKVLQPQV
jgi:hypothetical protein